MMREWVHCVEVTHNCSLLNHPNTFCGGMFKLNLKCDADSLLYSLSYFECNGHTVHLLTQQCLLPLLMSTVKSSLFMHAHSSPHPCLPGYMDVTQTVLITLTMAGIFPDRPPTLMFLVI